jgi:hypothetical protein
LKILKKLFLTYQTLTSLACPRLVSDGETFNESLIPGKGDLLSASSAPDNFLFFILAWFESAGFFSGVLDLPLVPWVLDGVKEGS